MQVHPEKAKRHSFFMSSLAELTEFQRQGRLEWEWNSPHSLKYNAALLIGPKLSEVITILEILFVAAIIALNAIFILLFIFNVL